MTGFKSSMGRVFTCISWVSPHEPGPVPKAVCVQIGIGGRIDVADTSNVGSRFLTRTELHRRVRHLGSLPGLRFPYD
jgi:hypothetical protein